MLPISPPRPHAAARQLVGYVSGSLESGILFNPDSIASVCEKIVPGLSTESSIAITERPIQLPYESITKEKAMPQGHKPITQGKGQPSPGAVQ